MFAPLQENRTCVSNLPTGRALKQGDTQGQHGVAERETSPWWPVPSSGTASSWQQGKGFCEMWVGHLVEEGAPVGGTFCIQVYGDYRHAPRVWFGHRENNCMLQV